MQTKNEHADPKQTETIKKLSTIEANQSRMMDAMASLKDENYIIWEEVAQTKNTLILNAQKVPKIYHPMIKTKPKYWNLCLQL